MSKLQTAHKWLIGGAFNRVCTLGLIALVIGLVFERWWWVADAFAQLRLHNTVALIVLGIGFAVTKRKKWLIAAVAGVLIGLIFTVPPLFKTAPSAKTSDANVLKILSHNLEFVNDNYEAELAAIEAANADVVILMEVTFEWKKHLKRLEDIYPHYRIEAEGGRFGIAVFSNLPDTEMTPKGFGSDAFQSIVARLEFDGRPITIFGTHPPPAVGGALLGKRNRHLKFLARNISVETAPLIVAGDLNITSSSSAYRNLLSDANLLNSGTPLRPTWNPYGVPGISARLDHALVSKHWRVVSSKVGPACGSDHRMLVTELVLE